MTVTATQPEKVEPEVGQLPAGWTRTILEEVTLPVFSISIRNKPAGSFKYIDIGSIDNKLLKIVAPQELNWDKAPSRAQQIVASSDVVFSTVRTYLKNIALVPDHLDGEIASTGFCILRPAGEIAGEFIYYLAQSRDFLESLGRVQRGTSYPAVRDSDVKEQRFFLPPLAEQRRIVTKIEELFSKLDAGVQELKRTRALLKRYRQSVLHAAVTGELSRGWREAQGSELEDARHLLAHILDERRARWATSGRKGKYAEPQEPDVVGLPELPKGWVWVSVGELLGAPILNGLSIRGSDSPPGTAALRLNAMTETGIDFSKIRFLPIEADEVDDLHIQAGDFFVSRGNGSLHLVGRGTIAQTPPFTCIFPDTMMRLRFLGQLNGWAKTIWPSRSIREQIESGAKTTAGIWKIAQPQLANLVLPLPPLSEQSYIVAEVERRLSILANVEVTVEAELKRAESTRQGILRRAFAGQLVPQDAADEPASVLLERIQAERLAAGAAAVRASGKRGRKAKWPGEQVLLAE